MDLFDSYKIITTDQKNFAIVYLKPCLLEIPDKALLEQLVIQYIKEKAPHIHKVEVILKPLHILSITL
ncbi:hypothetical protein [Defluviitalea saccharophila]|uniref:Uncharacterized protein n=1 Tax=Defluviitalea saccharophila TaxID=879970 RepID=A0ABZ2Y9R8_9FIRM|nr:hypothetical protein [Candidatus Epulonipiscium sp.]